MKWRVELRPEVEQDVAEAAAWYESRQTGLGAEFTEEIIEVWAALAGIPPEISVGDIPAVSHIGSFTKFWSKSKL